MILAHKRLSIAAAAAMVLAASVVLCLLPFSLSGAAYALEQTIEANSHVTSYHVKISPPESAMGVGEAWVQLGPGSLPRNARMDLFGGKHGDRVAIMSGGRGQFWWKAKNIRLLCSDPWVVEKAIEQCTKLRALFDPKMAFEQLLADEEAGKVQVTTQKPAKDGDPITLTVTSKGDPRRRFVYEVNPRTRLVERALEYRSDGKQWKQAVELDYLDYNKPIDPKVFQPLMPKDVMTVDPEKIFSGKPGESKLSDRERAVVNLASQFFDTLVGGEYRALGRLNDVRSATWKITSVVKRAGRGTETSTAVGMFLAPSRGRIENTTKGRAKVQLFSGDKDDYICLIPAARIALVTSLKNRPRGAALDTAFVSQRKLIADVRRRTDQGVKRLGVETIDGRRAEGFRIREGSTTTEIWADLKTSLPVRFEIVASFGPDEIRTTMTNYHVNVDLDESAFDLKVPAGYSVQNTQIDYFKEPINCFVDALKTAAEHNDGLFPSSLSGEHGLFDVLHRAVTALETKHGKDSPEAFRMRYGVEMNEDIAFRFLASLSKETNDWHYAGQNVKLHTSGRPIFWYRPTGAKYHSVVFADLNVKQLVLEALQFPYGPPSKPLGGDEFEVTFRYFPVRNVKSVSLVGPFNDWKPTANKMDGPDKEGCFTTAVKLKKGTHEYQFVPDGQDRESDLGNLWGNNGKGEAHAGLLFDSPAKPLGNDLFEVTFTYRPAKKLSAVYLAGSFNNWKPTAHKMDGPDKDGRFTTVLKLKKGVYEYKFVLDGKTWQPDPNNPWRTGFFQNSLMYVGGAP
jgi:outer membrane lipoprotein-sorting protein